MGHENSCNPVFRLKRKEQVEHHVLKALELIFLLLIYKNDLIIKREYSLILFSLLFLNQLVDFFLNVHLHCYHSLLKHYHSFNELYIFFILFFT
jgi:hypothetical protein